MTTHASIRPLLSPSAGASAEYEEDLHAWALVQARLIRDKRWAEVDIENVGEEIDSVGRSQRTELRNRIATLTEHLLKLDLALAIEPRRGWRETVRRTRLEIDRLLQDSPSLRRELPGFLEEEQQRVAILVAELLEDQGEADAAAAARSRTSLYAVDQVLGSWLPDGPGRD